MTASQLKLAFLFLFFLVFLLSGGLGLKTEKDCTEQEEKDRVLCYHEVAISYAVVGDAQNAKKYCEKIRNSGSRIANAQSNICFADIARHLNDASLCNMIIDDEFARVFSGAEVTREVCLKTVAAEQAKPKCAVVFILPILFLLILFQKYPSALALS